MTNELDEVGAAQKHAAAQLIAKMGWGFTLIWIGAAILGDMGWNLGLFGVGVIALGGQITRYLQASPVDRFALFFGSLFCVFGIAGWLSVRLDGKFLPAVSIALGSIILVSALLGKRKAHRGASSAGML